MRVGRDLALIDAEEVDAPRERVGTRLEDVGEQLLVGHRLERHALDLEAAVLDRARQVLDDRVEEAVGGEVACRHAACHREDVAVVRLVLEGLDDLVVVDLLALEVALHEVLVDLGDLVHELLAVLLGLGLKVVGDRDLLGVLATGAVVLVGLHVDEVDDAADLVLGADGDLGGDRVRPEGGLERLQRAEEVGALAVEHVHEDQAGDVELLGALPQASGGDLDAHHRVDDEDRRLAHAQRAERVGDEARLARGVEEVDLAVHPFERAQRRRDRHPARLLVVVGVRDRRAVGHRAEPVGRARLVQQRLVQRGLAGAAMADERHVPDAVRGAVHVDLPPLLR